MLQNMRHKYRSLSLICNPTFDLSIQEFSKDSVNEAIKVGTYLSKLILQLRCDVKIRVPTTLGDAMKYARLLKDKFTTRSNVEDNFTHNRNSFHKDKSFFNSGSYTEQNNDAMQVDNLTITKSRFKNKTCYQCGREGHFASNCPRKSKN